MSTALLDSHVVVWLAAKLVGALGRSARRAVEQVVGRAATLDWTREPCGRFIAAQAEVAGARLVTKDRLIRAHCPAANW